LAVGEGIVLHFNFCETDIVLIGHGICGDVALRDIARAGGDAVCLLPRPQTADAAPDETRGAQVWYDPEDHEIAKEILANLGSGRRTFLAGVVPYLCSFVGSLTMGLRMNVDSHGPAENRSHALESACARADLVVKGLDEVAETCSAKSLPVAELGTVGTQKISHQFGLLVAELREQPGTRIALESTDECRRNGSRIAIRKLEDSADEIVVLNRVLNERTGHAHSFDTGFIDSAIVREAASRGAGRLHIESSVLLLNTPAIAEAAAATGLDLYRIDPGFA
jgi:hypothetical protein